MGDLSELRNLLSKESNVENTDIDSLRNLLTGTRKESNPIETFVKNEIRSAIGNDTNFYGNLYLELKKEIIKGNYLSFSKDFIKRMIENKFPLMSIRSKQRFVANFFTYLKKNNLISEEITLRKVQSWTSVNQFGSCDYNSYETLMTRNGYWIYKFYVYDTSNGMVRRRLIGTATRKYKDNYYELLRTCNKEFKPDEDSIKVAKVLCAGVTREFNENFEKLANECDFYERRSVVPRKNQGVRKLTGNMSYSCSHRFQKVKVFKLLELGESPALFF